MPVKNKNGLTLSLEELEVKSDNSWESNNDEKAAKKIVNKHLVRLLNFIPGEYLQVNDYEIVVKFFHISHNLT